MKYALLALVIAAVVIGVLMTRRARRQMEGYDTPAELMASSPNTLFGDDPMRDFPGPKARAWAYGTLYEAGVDADADPAYAAGVLQRAEPKLTREQAETLIRAML